MIPRSTPPSPTKVGISAAGRKIRAIGRFFTRAMSRRVSRRNWISEPAKRSMAACWRRPSVANCQLYLPGSSLTFEVAELVQMEEGGYYILED